MKECCNVTSNLAVRVHCNGKRTMLVMGSETSREFTNNALKIDIAIWSRMHKFSTPYTIE